MMRGKWFITPVQVIAWILLIASILACGACIGTAALFGIRGVYDGDFNNAEYGFWDSVWVSYYMREQTESVATWLSWQDIIKEDPIQAPEGERIVAKYEESFQKSNLRARVTLEDGTVIDVPGALNYDQMEEVYGGYDYMDTLMQGTAIQWYVDPTFSKQDELLEAYRFYQESYHVRWNVLYGAAAAAILGLLCWIYLLCAAGHRFGKSEISLNGFDRMPMDVLTILIAILIPCLLMVAVTFGEGVWADSLELSKMRMAAIVGPTAVAAWLFVLWTVTFSARAKAHMLLRNTLCWRFVSWCIRQLRRLFGGRQKKTAEKKKSGIGDQLAFLVHNINIVWKLGIVTVVALLVLSLLAHFSAESGFIFLMWLLLCVWMVLAVVFFGLQLHQLKIGGEKLAAGDFNYKVQTSSMYWDLKKHAENLNSISDGMGVAVEQRLKSERMKYELLTNVSHDIKTPLTSIVNYVELLKQEPIEGEKARSYLEVLDRQAARLKKLIADLIDASKASTGNVTVHLEKMDVAELLRQCAGEYSERFAGLQLSVVLDLPEGAPHILADGRLLGRIFDNLMGNILKYALPGTRVYLDLEDCGSRVVVSLKNISRDRLNIAADELMERFVRGDASRATEGSGLGLSIARSLTELMGGKMDILVDGDLFKVSLYFEKMD